MKKLNEISVGAAEIIHLAAAQRNKNTSGESGCLLRVLSLECVDCDAHYDTLFQEEMDNVNGTHVTLFFGLDYPASVALWSPERMLFGPQWNLVVVPSMATSQSRMLLQNIGTLASI